MALASVTRIVEESVYFFLHLFPYLLIGIFAGALLEAALSRYREIGWLKHKSGVSSYLLVSLIGVSTPL